MKGKAKGGLGLELTVDSSGVCYYNAEAVYEMYKTEEAFYTVMQSLKAALCLVNLQPVDRGFKKYWVPIAFLPAIEIHINKEDSSLSTYSITSEAMRLNYKKMPAEITGLIEVQAHLVNKILQKRLSERNALKN